MKYSIWNQSLIFFYIGNNLVTEDLECCNDEGEVTINGWKKSKRDIKEFINDFPKCDKADVLNEALWLNNIVTRN